MYRNMLKNVPKACLDNIADPPKRKKCLSEDEVKNLLYGHITIEEKIDGGVVGLAYDGNTHLAIGKHTMIPDTTNSKGFYELNNWIYSNYEKIQKIPIGWIVYGEWMRASHNILYNKLPDYFISFDVWNGHKYLDITNRSIFLYEIGFEEISIIHSGTNLGIEDILFICEGKFGVSNKSRFSSTETFEGLVIKNDNGLVGKYVRKEFMSSTEEHWLKSPLIENKISKYKDKGK